MLNARKVGRNEVGRVFHEILDEPENYARAVAAHPMPCRCSQLSLTPSQFSCHAMPIGQLGQQIGQHGHNAVPHTALGTVRHSHVLYSPSLPSCVSCVRAGHTSTDSFHVCFARWPAAMLL